MANWCNNTVVFKGNPEAIEQIQKLFMAMAEKEDQEEMGQLPDFTTLYSGYFFDIYCTEECLGTFQYQTKWSPNLEIVQQIAQHYKVDFIQDYEESGMQIYGRAIYENSILTDIFLENSDFESFSFNEDADSYHFEGKTYESDCEILEILLERKTGNHKT
jgi:hypothetical protein